MASWAEEMWNQAAAQAQDIMDGQAAVKNLRRTYPQLFDIVEKTPADAVVGIIALINANQLAKNEIIRLRKLVDEQ